MRYLSLFSGIEAASVAFEPLGWTPVAFAEIESLPSKVLAHHWPHVPNLGDVTKITEAQVKALGEVDVVVFGFPCQDLSVAGKRKGLKNADGSKTRSGLFYTAMQIVRWSKARWAVAENVNGLFSSNGGRDFAAVVGELCGSEIGLPRDGWRNSGMALGSEGLVEWSTLDAQYFGLAQRRKRVFLVRDIGDWQSRPPLLLDAESLRRHTPPRRGEGQGASGAFETSSNGGRFTEVAPTLDASCKDGPVRAQIGCGVMESYAIQAGATRENPASGPDGVGVKEGIAYTLEARAEVQAVCMATGQAGAEIGIGIGTTLTCNHEAPIVTQEIAHTLRGEGFDASEDGTGRGTPLICVHGTQDPCHDENVAFALGRNSGQENAIAFTCKDHGADAGEISPTLRSMGHDKSHANGGGQVAVAFGIPGNWIGREPANGGNATTPMIDVSPCQTKTDRHAVATPSAVRRLSPVECERLQGFPDNFTLIPKAKGYKPRKGEDHAETVAYLIGHGFTQEEAEKLSGHPDGPRYKQLGNSMAIPVIAWVGRRIEKFTR